MGRKLNILITGGNGYVAKSLANAFKDKYDITTISRSDFDLTDRKAVDTWFKTKYFDVVIHTAIVGGSRLKPEDSAILDQNLNMYYNLLNNKDKFNKFINFGSGFEFIPNPTPYAISKNTIYNSLIDKPNFYNIRIFGIFDENEWETRFIKTCIKKYINHQDLEIHKDKYMDFFYMEDLISLVDYYINSNNPPKEIDCTYKESYKLSDIVNIINNLDSHKVEINTIETGLASSYIGQFYEVELNYTGLEQGIKNVYSKLK
jgi:GDP-L-fucose synthase